MSAHSYNYIALSVLQKKLKRPVFNTKRDGRFGPFIHKDSVFVITLFVILPKRWRSSRVVCTMVAAMAGGGAVQKLLQVATNWARHCSISQRNRMYSAWNDNDWEGVLAAWNIKRLEDRWNTIWIKVGYLDNNKARVITLFTRFLSNCYVMLLT